MSLGKLYIRHKAYKLQYVASAGSGYQHQKGAKVLLTTQAIKTDSTFRAKALRRKLVWGGGGRGKHACLYTSEYIKTTRDKIKTNQMDLIKTRNK